MSFPVSLRTRMSAAMLGLVALLSCQNEVTAPQASTKVVSGHWNTEILRMPDSAAWALHDTTGTFALTTVAADTSFTVQAILPRVMAPKDTLVLSLFTLSLRTTLAFCKADGSGNLTLWDTSTHDAKAAHLLQGLDSLQKKGPAIWGSKTDSVAAQVRSLQKLYATLILSGDGILKGFPAVHPVGIDSVAVVDQILILASAQKLTLHGLDSLVASLAALDSANVRKEARKLGQAKKLDTLALFPAPVVIANQAPIFAGATDISKTLDTTAQSVSNWITAISAGPSNESGQKVHFEVVADSGASLFSVLPTVDSSGTLRYQAKSVGRGVFRVRAHDNGDSTGTNVNVSSWKSFAIQLFSRPVLIATGPSDTVRLVEDSATTVSFTVQNFVGSSLTVKFAPVDTSLISARSWKLAPDANGKVSITLQGKADAFGGPITTIVTLSDSVDASNLIVPITIVARNDPPSFGGASNIIVTANAAVRTYPGWIDAISPGPANESGQKVSFAVQVLSGATLFAVAPSVDSTGTLSFTGKVNSSGPATIRVRAKDNGDSTGSNVDTSAWKSATITFDVAPTLTLSVRSVSTYESIQVSAGTATVSDLETSVNNLTLSWIVLDSAVLRHDSVYVGTAGGTRNIQLHPVQGTWGTNRIVFTLTDSLGVSATDTLLLTVQAVNHAPTLTMKSPSLLATTWKGEQTFALASASWDNVSTSQKGRFDLALSNASDTAYLSTLRMDSDGVLHVLAKIDNSIALKFKIRAHDSAGTANGGVDTSAWSAVQTLQLVDTVLDADGNSYRAKVLGTQTWMLSNLQRVAGTAACANDSCGKYGRMYTWEQALNMTSFSTPYSHQGICPEGWHVPTSDEWGILVSWSGDSGTYKLRSNETWTDTLNHQGTNYITTGVGTDKFNFSLWKTTHLTSSSAASGDFENSIGTNLWASSMASSGSVPFATFGVFEKRGTMILPSTSYPTLYAPTDISPVRCMKDTTERAYRWIAP